MIDAIQRCVRKAQFVLHLGVSTGILLMCGFFGVLMWVGVQDTQIQVTDQACVFERLEPRGGETRTVLKCGDVERITMQRVMAGWAWQHRDAALLCDLNAHGQVLSCKLAP